MVDTKSTAGICAEETKKDNGTTTTHTATETTKESTGDGKPVEKKRKAERQITKDDEEEDEDGGNGGTGGTFRKADASVLAKRKILRVKTDAAGKPKVKTNPFANAFLTAKSTDADSTSSNKESTTATSKVFGAGASFSGFQTTKQQPNSATSSDMSDSSNNKVVLLRTVVFMGSARDITPPWGGDARLGDRVLRWVKRTLKERKGELGGGDDDENENNNNKTIVEHNVTVIDPKEVFAKEGSLSEISTGELSVPTFFLTELPPKTQALKDTIVNADCYVIVSPEYNHVVPPALASVMGHFGGSCYKCKPSAVVTYSSGPWGGMRGAMAICTMCHELGCLPVSKLCGLPGAGDMLSEDGKPKDPNNRMLKQLPEMLTQLEWMATAMKRQRDEFGSF